jgi:hypothetical protein
MISNARIVRVTVAMLAACAGGGATGCSGSYEGDPSQRWWNPADCQEMGDFFLPTGTLTDWLSYSDQVSVVSVVNEQEIPASPEVLMKGKGGIRRLASLHIDETIWKSEGFIPRAGDLSLTVAGWWQKGGTRVPASMGCAPRLEVGGRYVMPLVGYRQGWSPLTFGSVLAAGDDPVATADIKAWGHNPVARSLAGKTVAEIKVILAETPLDPIAEKYRDLPVEERARAVQADKSRSP